MLADRIIEEQERARQAKLADLATRSVGNALAREMQLLLKTDNVRRTLQMIRSAEGTQQYKEPERVNFGGSRKEDLSTHGNVMRRFTTAKYGSQNTSATGAYQFLGRTWNNAQRALDLPNFERQSQDLAALYLIKQRGALEAAISGDVPKLAKLLGGEWASLGNNNYGQPVRGQGYLQAAFNAPLSDGGTKVKYAPDNNARTAGTRVANNAIRKTGTGFRAGGGSSDQSNTHYDNSNVDPFGNGVDLFADSTTAEHEQFLQKQYQAMLQEAMKSIDFTKPYQG